MIFFYIKKGSDITATTFAVCILCILFYTEFFLDTLWKSVFVNDDVHGFVTYESF